MTAEELLAQARQWTRPDRGHTQSPRQYAHVDPTIRLLAGQGWSAAAITRKLIEVKAFPADRRSSLYARTCRVVRQVLAKN